MKRNWPLFSPILVWTTIVAVAAPAFAQKKADPLDWPYWRGPEYNSISRETGLPDTINPGRGRGQQSGLETRRSGRPQHADRPARQAVHDPAGRPGDADGRRAGRLRRCGHGRRRFGNRGTTSGRATCPIRASAGRASSAIPETGNIYALGACRPLSSATTATRARCCGRFRCTSRLGLLSTYGGRTNYPIVFEDLVILGSVIVSWGDMAMPAHRFMAFDKAHRPGRLDSSARGCARRTRFIPLPCWPRSAARSC